MQKQFSHHRSFFITKEQLEQVQFHSEKEAAKLLGISIATLKRKVKQLKMGKWPTKTIQRKRIRKAKMTLKYILHEFNEPTTTFIDQHTITCLQIAFVQHLQNS